MELARLECIAALDWVRATLTPLNKPAASGQGIQLEWEILVDEEEKGYISAYMEPYGLYVRQQIDNTFFWHVLKDNDDDTVNVAEGEAPSLVAAMAAAEAAAIVRAF